MQIVLASPDGDRELDVVIHDPAASVADLVRSLAAADGGHGLALEVDGAVVPGHRRLDRAAVRSGSTVRLVSADASAPTPSATPGAPSGIVEVAVVGGLDAGARAALGPGRWSLGRHATPLPLRHDTASEHHAVVEVSSSGTTIADAGSVNGTWVDGRPSVGATPLPVGAVARLGAVQVEIRPTLGGDRAGPPLGPRQGGPTTPVHRPPRPGPPPPPETVELPLPPDDRTAPPAVGAVAVLAPVVLGGGLVLLTGQLTFALTFLLGPLFLLTGAADGRWRARRERRRAARRHREQLADVTCALARHIEAERARRRNEAPDLAELLRRIEGPSTRLWERRPGHHDWLRLRIGIGSDRWEPPVRADGPRDGGEAWARVEAAARLPDVAVTVDLGDGLVGVIGPRPAALAVVRSLVVQACTLHGPADLVTVVMAEPDRAGDWDWAKWLPHIRDPGGSGARLAATTRGEADVLARSLATSPATDPAGPAPTLLLVIDGESLTTGRRSPGSALLRNGPGPVAGLVVASTEDRLPASCRTVVEVEDDDGTTRIRRLRKGTQVGPVLACGLSEETARRAGRGLARFHDPEGEGDDGALPTQVALLPLLGLDPPKAGAIAGRWAATIGTSGLATPLGITDEGPLIADLVRDGPHILVAGTTGSGKSELLRALVAGLAASHPPDRCTFLLVDFKGGSAFDRCASLPHTVGLVTDLDAHLAARALRSLEAELRHRERVLRHAGAVDLAAYHRQAGDHPDLPRLVVVVDEFATLKAELPGFVEALVGVAQRGRSLGVHLVLATQRPSGAVSEDIRANTDLRIALRVQSPADSCDVIDGPDASRLARGRPGRALARFAPDDVVALQAALSTTPPTGHRQAVEVRSFALGPLLVDPAAGGHVGPSGLALLVDACRQAHAASGRGLPRRPWLAPLPAEVAPSSLPAAPPAVFGAPGAELPFALADVPDAQARVPVGWVPAEGHLLLAGLPGSGTTTALLAVALAAARASSPGDLHLYALDLGRGDLAVLAGLPHTGAVVTGGERERQARLVGWLRSELRRRRRLPSVAEEPRLLVLVDGYDAFRSEWDEGRTTVLDDMDRVWGDGPALGVHLAVAAAGTGALPGPLRGRTRQQLLFRLADDLGPARPGFRTADLSRTVPGRATHVTHGHEVQVARPPGGDWAHEVEAVAARHPEPGHRRPVAVEVLPRAVALTRLLGHAHLDDVPRFLPLGVGEHRFVPAGLVLHPGEHALVAGPARSGRTTALAVAGAVAGRAGWRTAVVAGPRSSLGATGDLGPRLAPADPPGLSHLLDDPADADRPLLLLVDDAELVDPDGTTMPSVLARPDVVVVAAGRNDALRAGYGHWTRALRSSRVGLLLQPDVDLDGDLLDCRLPRRATTPIGPGRGYLCRDGAAELLQVAQLGES